MVQHIVLLRWKPGVSDEAILQDHLQPLGAERSEISVPVDKPLLRDPSRDWEFGANVGMGPPLDF